MEKRLSPADEFSSAVKEFAPRFNIQLNSRAVTRLREYYELVLAWNTRLHLVAPCSPAEFATRHVLESLLAVRYMPVGARVVDVGSGGGLPSVPCLIARPDLRAVLVESSKKKVVFLREALRVLGLGGRTDVIAGRFEALQRPEADCLTCRALDRFSDVLPGLVEWSEFIETLLLFGGDSLRAEIERNTLAYESIRIPQSERRFLFIVPRRG